jgi:hypothetical protein
MPAMDMSEPTAPTTMAAGGRAAAFGTGTGPSMGGGGGGGNGVPINFFGIKDLANSVVIMIDVSDSMFTRTGDAEYPSKLVKHGTEQSFQVVRDQAIELVKSLTPQTTFDIIRWSGGAYAWKPQLVPATDENKTDAITHIQNEVDYKTAKPKGRPGGTRHDYALELAFSLKPETIYMITDGNATAAEPGARGLKEIPAQELYHIAEEGQKTLPHKARLHTIYYINAKEKDEERAMLMGLASRNGGQFKTVQAQNRGAGTGKKKEKKKKH